MKILAKSIAFITNFINYFAGVYVAVTLIFKLDFFSVFYFEGFSSNELLFTNLIILAAALALLGTVSSMLVNEYKGDKEIEFPIIFELVPVIVSIVSIYYAFTGETTREKILVIVFAVVYALLSAVTIYTGSKSFQIFKK